jgi:hypothetical protein
VSWGGARTTGGRAPQFGWRGDDLAGR